MIQKIYGSFAQPFTRVVCGVPMSWDLSTAATSYPFEIGPVAWSPCNKFIAIAECYTMKVDVLDSATLQPFQTLEPPQEIVGGSLALIFSPDTQMLTCLGSPAHCQFGHVHGFDLLIVSWDLQTGGVVKVIKQKEGLTYKCAELTYSRNGKMIGVIHWCPARTMLSIYDVVSGVHILDAHYGEKYPYGIWTHGEFLQFATDDHPNITIQEVGFAAEAPQAVAETLSVPGNVISGTSFSPGGLGRVLKSQSFTISYRIALYNEHTHAVMVWSIQDSKYLLYHMDINQVSSTVFSFNCGFFACSTVGGEVYLWRETSTGYALLAKVPAITRSSKLLFSPNGESIIAFCGSGVQLWHTSNLTTTSSSTPTKVPCHTADFLLDFIPDKLLVVVMRLKDDTVKIVDLNSGLLQLTIETSIEGYGLRVVGEDIVVVGKGKAISWNLPGPMSYPGGSMNVGDSVQTIIFDETPSSKYSLIGALISPDFHYIATFRKTSLHLRLGIYDISTGQRFPLKFVVGETPMWFTPGVPSICCTVRGKGAQVVKITQDGPADDPIMIPAADIGDKVLGCPWTTSGGYQVTSDGWILNAGRKRLLMLPPPWQSCMEQRAWNEQFLVLLHSTLPEPVIIELEP